MQLLVPYLNDLLVGAPSHENVLLVLVWVELHTVGDLVVREARDALPRLSVPQLDVLVKSSTQKALSIIREADVANHLGVANEGPQAVPLIVYIPKLHFAFLCVIILSGLFERSYLRREKTKERRSAP